MTDQRPDTTRPDMSDPDRAPDTTLSLQEAAVWAGANERTLRRWIKAGRLLAVKDDGQYRILVADLQRASRVAPDDHRAPDTDNPGARAAGPDTSDTSDMSGQNTMSGIDLTPLADLIERQARELAEMREAAAVWQERARILENRLLALSAGDSSGGPSTTSPNAPGATIGGVGLFYRVGGVGCVRWAVSAYVRIRCRESYT